MRKEHGAKRANDIKRETIEAKKTKLKESSKRVKNAMDTKDKNSGKTGIQKVKKTTSSRFPSAKKPSKGILD